MWDMLTRGLGSCEQVARGDGGPDRGRDCERALKRSRDVLQLLDHKRSWDEVAARCGTMHAEEAFFLEILRGGHETREGEGRRRRMMRVEDVLRECETRPRDEVLRSWKRLREVIQLCDRRS